MCTRMGESYRGKPIISGSPRGTVCGTWTCWRIRPRLRQGCRLPLRRCHNGHAVTAWHEEPIYKKHDREAFDCGEEALNEFLRRYARKSHRELGGEGWLAMTYRVSGWRAARL